MSDDESREVVPLANPPIPAGEHPLQTSWSFWYDKKMPRGAPMTSFHANMRLLGTFNTVEGFWRHYVHLKRPSQLPRDTNYYLFREQLFPAWETFPSGGCWILKVKRRVGVLGKLWQDLLFAAVGEMFETPNVVGVCVATRSKEDFVSVWNKDDLQMQTRFMIGEKLKRILSLEPSTVIEYKSHRDSLRDGSTFRNARAYVFAAKPDAAAGATAGRDEAEAEGEQTQG